MQLKIFWGDNIQFKSCIYVFNIKQTDRGNIFNRVNYRCYIEYFCFLHKIYFCIDSLFEPSFAFQSNQCFIREYQYPKNKFSCKNLISHTKYASIKLLFIICWGVSVFFVNIFLIDCYTIQIHACVQFTNLYEWNKHLI